VSKPSHARALDILVHRCGTASLVRLSGGKSCTVHDVAWGYDLGEDIAHITTNISPGPPGPCEIDFFHANEIARIEDVEDGSVLFELPSSAS